VVVVAAAAAAVIVVVIEVSTSSQYQHSVESVSNYRASASYSVTE